MSVGDRIAEMRLCVVISSIGKTDQLTNLLDSLTKQTEIRFDVGVCDQSSDGVVSEVVAKFESRLHIFSTRSHRGLSSGRNAVVSRASSEATHFLFPNDTSSLPPDFVADLYQDYADVDVLAVSYVHDGAARYRFPPGSQFLTRDNVWQIIEPAMVLSRRAFDMSGGFDEQLGTGSAGPWQSGEGTDLLLKLIDMPLTVGWAPHLYVTGVSQGFGLSNVQRREKLRSYGRGYGFILSTWGYPIAKRLRAIMGPFVSSMRSRSWPAIVDSYYSSLGRIEGVLGGVRHNAK